MNKCNRCDKEMDCDDIICDECFNKEYGEERAKQYEPDLAEMKHRMNMTKNESNMLVAMIVLILALITVLGALT